MKTCIYCGSENEDSQKVCAVCGSEMPVTESKPEKKGFFGKKQKSGSAEKKHCPNCLSENDAGAQVCAICGSMLSAGGSSESQGSACPVCGAWAAPGDSVCASCGSTLTDMGGNGGGKQKFTLSAPVKWIAAGVAAVAMTVAVVLMVLNSGPRQVAQAAENMGSAFSRQLQQMPTLTAFINNQAALSDADQFRATVDLSGANLELVGHVNYDSRNKALDGYVAYENDPENVDLEFDFSSDNRDFCLSADRLTADIYGFALKDFSRVPLAKLLPLPTDEEGGLILFPSGDLDEQMEDRLGDSWKKFRDSIEVDEINERQMSVGGVVQNVRAFEITWDTNAALSVMGGLLGRGESFLSGFAGFFSAMEPDCRIYMNEDDILVAADFVLAGNKCTIEFSGTENIWESCRLTSIAMGGVEGAVTGYLTSGRNGIDARIQWQDKMEYYFNYQDATGKFELGAARNGTVWYVDGSITSRNGGAGITCQGYWGDLGLVSVGFQMEPLTEKPRQLADKYVDLTDMNISDWQRLLIELSN